MLDPQLVFAIADPFCCFSNGTLWGQLARRMAVQGCTFHPHMGQTALSQETQRWPPALRAGSAIVRMRTFGAKNSKESTQMVQPSQQHNEKLSWRHSCWRGKARVKYCDICANWPGGGESYSHVKKTLVMLLNYQIQHGGDSLKVQKMGYFSTQMPFN